MKSSNGLGSRQPAAPKGLSLRATFDGVRLVVVGGTGFLGKVWWVLMLHRFPNLERIFLVVRSRPGQSAEERFWKDIATNECLQPLREQHGAGFEQFLRDKIQVLDGDIVRPYCGIPKEARDELRGNVHALVNASGIVDFQPPLDVALEVNAFGMQSLVQLARDLGDTPILHTSTCYVAGYRPGIVEEVNPLDHPFPYAGKLERALWDPDREIAECLDIIEQAKHRANDAFRESHFLDQAKQNLLLAGEPAKGAVLEAEIQRVRRKFVEQQLAAFGQERAKFWGWPNTYTYTKSIGEQIVAKSKLRFTIVRPAIVESCVAFPLVGWNEGVNTSAPLIFAVREGQQQFPGAAIRLDIIPCDMVATGITLALAELIEGSHKPVYQFGTSDSNPTTMARIYELSGLYKRKHFQRTGRGTPLSNFLQSHLEGTLMPSKSFEKFGPRTVAQGANLLADWLGKAPQGAIGTMLEPSSKALRKFSKQQAKIADIVGQFAPFTAELDYEFRCDNTRAAYARLSEEERAQFYWSPEKLDWREWFLEVHVPGLERWVFPELERRINKPLRPLKRHETLTRMLEEMAERHGLAVALQRTEPDGLSRFSYRDWYARSLACAARLQARGVGVGQRVALIAQNHPDWPIAFFGILLAGATVVPLSADIRVEHAAVLLRAAEAKLVVLDEAAQTRLSSLLRPAERLLLAEASAEGTPGQPHSAREEDIAVLSYALPEAGLPAGQAPRGVLLSHYNLTSLVASLGPLFPLGKDDRVLSVLPLHQSFEFTCGMLLPLSRGARVVYLDEPSNARLEQTLEHGRITALVGVPELWQALEQRINARVAGQGAYAARVFDIALQFNRLLGANLGLDIGRLLFGEVHSSLGGHLKYLVSGGSQTSEQTQRLFAGLGLHLTEGYGPTEAAPVLTVNAAKSRSRAGQVGRAIPGVELRIDAPNAEGVGEVQARGPSIMAGYVGEVAAIGEALSADGWLRTGDQGTLDSRGRLRIMERARAPEGGDAEATSESENDGDAAADSVEALLGESVAEERSSTSEALNLPAPLRAVSQAWLGRGLNSFYSNFMRTRVTGRAFIPEQQGGLLVVANHASHLDIGLVKYALGDRGRKLVALAAQDHFFEGVLKKAFFQNFTRLVPIAAKASPRETLEKVAELLAQGNVVLLFPEGTRTRDGALQEFKPLASAVALKAGVDVLPLALLGTFEALPKGANLVKGRKLTARIGLPLSAAALRARCAQLTPAQAVREVTALLHRAVDELQQGRVLDLAALPAAALVAAQPAVAPSSAKDVAAPRSEAEVSTPLSGSALRPVFEELEQRFKPGSVKKSLSYYFSIGSERYTLKLNPSSYLLEAGNTVERADCVVKSTPDLFRRMVLEGYTPGTREILTGALKSNNIAALKDLQRIFDLKSPRKSKAGVGARIPERGERS